LRKLRGMLRSLLPLKCSFCFEEGLVQSIRSLSEQEGRGVEQVAAELLGLALAKYGEVQAGVWYWNSLTPREKEVVALVCQDFDNREIAERLLLARGTVKAHLHNILVKLGLSDKVELRKVFQGWDFSAWPGA